MFQDECIPFKVSGVLSGELTYHTLDNIENSPTWQIAPQVGDFFKLKYGEVEEEYEITQLYDQLLTNSNGINPLFGKYIFNCLAVRRTDSHEVFNKNNDEVLSELEKDADLNYKQDRPEYYKEKDNKCDESAYNELTNKIAKGIYAYPDKADYTYGGYQDYPTN